MVVHPAGEEAVGRGGEFRIGEPFAGVHRERLNGQATLQVRPVKDVVATLDFVMSEQKFRQRRNDISAWFNYGGQFGEYQTGSPSSPIIYGERMTNSDVAMGASRIQTKNKNQQIGLNLKWKASDALNFEFDAHHSTATSGANDPLGTSVTLATASMNRGDTSVDFSNKFPVLMIKGGALDPTKQELQGSVFGNSYQKNQVSQLQTKGHWKIDGDSSLDFGLSLTEVKNRSAFANVQRDTWGAGAAGGPAAMPDDIWKVDSISKYFSRIPGSSDPRLFNNFFYFNFEDLRAAAIKALGSDSLLKASFDFKDDFNTTEKSQAVFGQYNLAWDWGVPMDLSAGLRYERISPEGLWVSTEGGGPELIEADTIVLCAGQEPLRELEAPLKAAGVKVHLIGGALEAGELDAKRAILQGTQLACAL